MTTPRQLIIIAKNASENACSPYSGFKVGAALLCADGTVYTGCNIENSSFSATVCAERVAFFKAISEGKRDFVSIAVAGGRETVGASICPPCGVCRQVMAEFCNPDEFKIILPHGDNYDEYLLKDLLPLTFTNNSMG